MRYEVSRDKRHWMPWNVLDKHTRTSNPRGMRVACCTSSAMAERLVILLNADYDDQVKAEEAGRVSGAV